MTRFLPPVLGFVLLLACAALVYAPGLHGGFIFDDFPNLVSDPDWMLTTLTFDQLQRALGSGFAGALGRPLAVLSFGLNHLATGLDPFWLKLTNVLLHAFNGLLVWLLATRLFAQLPPSAPTPGRYAALLLALAWLLHPLQVSTVLYVVQRMEIGAATGILLALLAYVQARTLQIAGRSGAYWLLAALAAILVGLGFKETALLAPGYAFFLELCVFRFAGKHDSRSRGWIACYAVSGIVACAAMGYVMWSALQSSADASFRTFTPGERLLTQAPVLLMYLKQILLPLPQHFGFYYDNFPISHGLLDPPGTALAFLVLFALAATAVLALRRAPLVALGIGWFFLGHSLTSNVIPLELAFEHRNYLPLLGILLALVQPACWIGRHLSSRARSIAAAAPVLVLAAICAAQAATWGDPLRLAQALEDRNPDSQRASYSLAERLFIAANGDTTAPAWGLARAQFETASNLPGSSPLPLQALIILDGRAGIAIPSGVWERFADILTRRRIGPEGVGALHAVSECRISEACVFDDQELLQVFLRVLQHSPNDVTVHTLYANFAWNVLGDGTLAIRLQRRAVELAPEHPATRLALAKFLLASGSQEEGRRLLGELERQNAVPAEELQALRAMAAPSSISSPARTDTQVSEGEPKP